MNLKRITITVAAFSITLFAVFFAVLAADTGAVVTTSQFIVEYPIPIAR